LTPRSGEIRESPKLIGLSLNDHPCHAGTAKTHQAPVQAIARKLSLESRQEPARPVPLVGLEEPQCTHQAYAAESDGSSLPSDTDSKPKKESEREIRERY
jgi:hypothetical protein